MTDGFDRFRQSYAKVLISESPAELYRQITQGRVATKAMRGGSLFDYLVFDRDDKYTVVDARYKTGDRAGEPCTNWQGGEAKREAKDARAVGLVPVLPCELDEMAPQVQRVKERFQRLAGDDFVVAQEKVLWTSGLGTPSRGEPDWMLISKTGVVRTVDLKRSANAHPRFVQRQVFAMCWDVQAAAYREAAMSWAAEYEAADTVSYSYGGHTIIVASDDASGRVMAYPLGPTTMAVGQKRWEKAQRQWMACNESGTWPDYEETEIEPTQYIIRTELESYDFTDEEP